MAKQLRPSGHWIGYFYHMFLGNVDMGWIPFNPYTFSQPLQFAYSLLEELPVGVKEAENSEVVSLYPNPGNGLATGFNICRVYSNVRATKNGYIAYLAQVVSPDMSTPFILYRRTELRFINADGTDERRLVLDFE